MDGAAVRSYRIDYTDATDPGCPRHSVVLRAPSRLEAERRFWESCATDEGWRIVAIVPRDPRPNRGNDA